MQKPQRTSWWFLILLTIAAAVGEAAFVAEALGNEPPYAQQFFVRRPVINEPDPEPAASVPVAFQLDVPFTTQAPHANWNQPYQDACEEASALTVHYYFHGDTFTPATADSELRALIDFENQYFGDYRDTTAAETAEFMRAYWGYTRVDVLEDPSVDMLKQHIAAGRPVIVPAAGKQLGNPNFRNGGPLYHMLVLTGYTADTFITNDVGTRNGEDYVYAIDTVMNAMHDWNGGDVANGAKRAIVAWSEDTPH